MPTRLTTGRPRLRSPAAVSRGFVSGDSVTYVGGTATFADKNVMAGPSGTVNIGDPAGTDKVNFSGYVFVVGSLPETTVNIDSNNTTSDNNKLVLVLSKRNAV